MGVLMFSMLLCLQCLSLFKATTTEPVLRELPWTVKALESINFTIEVDIGDTLVLNCSGDSNSNLVSLSDEVQYNQCNASASRGVALRRGTCLGSLIPDVQLPVSIVQTSAFLKATLTFTPGTTTYFASFSKNRDLTDAYSNDFQGGECMEGLKLAVFVREPVTTTTVPPPTTPTSSPPTTTPSHLSQLDVTVLSRNPKPTASKMSIEPDKNYDPKPVGLSASVNGSRGLHTISSVLSCTLVLAVVALNRWL